LLYVTQADQNFFFLGVVDNHFPHLTVDQTLTFAVASRTPKYRLDNVNREKYINNMKEFLGRVLGLKHTFNTKVGNDIIRGVSGGERKRVSIAEAWQPERLCIAGTMRRED
jgi:ATP-binding cassette subfamily G (WHITE) protein 2 (SNQ2)